MADPMTDYELGVWLTEWTGGSTRGVDPAAVEHLGASLRPDIEKMLDTANEVVETYRALPWYWRAAVRVTGRASVLRDELVDLWRTAIRPMARHYGYPLILGGLGPAYWAVRAAAGRTQADEWLDELIRTAQEADRG